MSPRRFRDDDGAILVIAMLVVTTVALVVGTVLTQGDGSIRATVALRQVAGSTYAADGAAQVAINDLRTGYHTGNAEPAGWAYTNTLGTGCFGYNADGSTVDGVTLPNFYPASQSSGEGPTSAYVSCTPENDTGSQGSAVPISNANKPGNAILTLGTGAGEDGFTFKANGSSGAFRVRGGVWSNSTIVRSNNGTLQSTESIRAHSGCTPASAMAAPVVDCGAGTAPDPSYPSDLDLAGTGIPALQTPPASCAGSVTLQPGYYDDATKLNALTPNGGGNCLVKLAPGTYYFDFHNGASAGTYDMTTTGSSAHVWNVLSGTVVGGTTTSQTTVPGRCVNPIDDVSAQGVQLIFGGDSRIVVDKGAAMEVCASYRSNRPPIAIYGQKTGAATSTTVNGASALTPSGTPTVTPGSTFTGATAANLQAADGNQTTNANLAAWARDNTGANTQTASITMSGFTPATALPKGTILTGARLKVTHRSTGAQSVVTLTPNVGAGLSAYTLPARTTLGTEDIDLAARSGWGAFQQSVHDNGFTGASLKFDASLGKNQVAQLDAARLELTYYLPALRAQTSTVVTPGGEPVVKALGNNTLFYVQGTTYTPLASLNLSLNNIAESVFRFGVIARSLTIFETGSFNYPGAVIELPDNSPGWGVNGTLVQLKVYLCPGSSTCSAASGALALTSRVQLWDPTGTPVPRQRQISILSWSHKR